MYIKKGTLSIDSFILFFSLAENPLRDLQRTYFFPTKHGLRMRTIVLLMCFAANNILLMRNSNYAIVRRNGRSFLWAVRE